MSSARPHSAEVPFVAQANEEHTDNSLDYQFYQRACELAQKTPSAEDFQRGLAEGRYRFSQDDSLVSTLASLYQLNMHHLNDEWLAFSAKVGQSPAYGHTPLEAVLNWMINQPLDFLILEDA